MLSSGNIFHFTTVWARKNDTVQNLATTFKIYADFSIRERNSEFQRLKTKSTNRNLDIFSTLYVRADIPSDFLSDFCIFSALRKSWGTSVFAAFTYCSFKVFSSVVFLISFVSCT